MYIYGWASNSCLSTPHLDLDPAAISQLRRGAPGLPNLPTTADFARAWMIEFLAESNRIDISNVNRSSNHAALPDNLSENRSYKSGYVY